MFQFGNIKMMLLVIHALLSLVAADECPGTVQQNAFGCFVNFNTQLLNMHNSRETLFSGVDAELLRAFCSSFTKSMDCIQHLRWACPHEEQSNINLALVNLQGTLEELQQLCQHDTIVEIYARHMTCYMAQGRSSELCYERVLGSDMRLMKRMANTSLDDLCRSVDEVTSCIQGNINRQCGEEAGMLVPMLMKPMIRKSSFCDKIQFTTKIIELHDPSLSSSTANPRVHHRHVTNVRYNEEDGDSKGSRASLFRPKFCEFLILFAISVKMRHL